MLKGNSFLGFLFSMQFTLAKYKGVCYNMYATLLYIIDIMNN